MADARIEFFTKDLVYDRVHVQDLDWRYPGEEKVFLGDKTDARFGLCGLNLPCADVHIESILSRSWTCSGLFFKPALSDMFKQLDDIGMRIF